MCNFNIRSELIVHIIENELKLNPNQQIMILAHNKNLLVYLYKAIEYRKIAPVGYYIGGMKQKNLKLTESKKIILATYAMAEEALDIKTLTSLLMATPKSDVRQAVGRILRKKKSNAVVYDIVDSHSLFQRQWQKRCTWYRKQKFTITMANNEEYKKKQWRTLSTGGKRLNHKNPPEQLNNLLQGVCLVK